MSYEAVGSEDCLRPGTPLLQGQYLIERFLNAGGFGITYLARDSLDRRVVIKECYPSTMCCRSDFSVRARTRSNQHEFDTIVRLFGQEARRLSKLVHPNIVGVHQVFEDNGTAYMAMDFIEGKDLLDVVEQEPDRLPPQEIQRLLRVLLGAVEHVHQSGILHRDISPDNILLREDGQPVLIDFGAARDVARRSSRALSALHVVKDGYSPQEFYLAGTAQTSASDLYSMGATFYHLITGAPPQHSHVRLAALAAKERDPYPTLLGMVAGYPGGFLSAIDRALSVFPQDRMQTAAEWIESIDAERRESALRARAAETEEIEERISRLVAETNPAVLRAQAESARRAAEEKFAENEASRKAAEARARLRAEARAEAEAAARASTRRSTRNKTASDGRDYTIVEPEQPRVPNFVARAIMNRRRQLAEQEEDKAGGGANPGDGSGRTQTRLLSSTAYVPVEGSEPGTSEDSPDSGRKRRRFFSGAFRRSTQIGLSEVEP